MRKTNLKGYAYKPNKNYRYILSRELDKNKPFILFIGLNPSEADGELNDNTVSFLEDIVAGWKKYGGFYMGNLFARVHTDSTEIHTKKLGRPELNDRYLIQMGKKCEMVIFMWGNKGALYGRDKEVMKKFPNAYCLGLTANLNPRHTRGVSRDVKPIRYTGPNGRILKSVRRYVAIP